MFGVGGVSTETKQNKIIKMRWHNATQMETQAGCMELNRQLQHLHALPPHHHHPTPAPTPPNPSTSMAAGTKAGARGRGEEDTEPAQALLPDRPR